MWEEIGQIVSLVLHNLWSLVKCLLFFLPFAGLFILPWYRRLMNPILKWSCWIVGGIGGVFTGILVIIAILANLWTFLCLVLMAVGVVFFVGGAFGAFMGGINSGSSSKSEPSRTVWRDAAGGVHTNGVDARAANERMGKNPDDIKMGKA